MTVKVDAVPSSIALPPCVPVRILKQMRRLGASHVQALTVLEYTPLTPAAPAAFTPSSCTVSGTVGVASGAEAIMVA